MKSGWPDLPYDEWSETRDTLHAHTQVLGKLAAPCTGTVYDGFDDPVSCDLR